MVLSKCRNVTYTVLGLVVAFSNLDGNESVVASTSDISSNVGEVLNIILPESPYFFYLRNDTLKFGDAEMHQHAAGQ